MDAGKLKEDIYTDKADTLLSGKDTKAKQPLPIGIDDFRDIRESDFYYIDKTLMIRDFIEMRDKVTLIARPRRFGKTLNMSMIRDFFDIAQDSHEIFKGLAIMDTEYANHINSRPVIYLTFKDCKGNTVEELTIQLKRTLIKAYTYLIEQLNDKPVKDSGVKRSFYKTHEYLWNDKASHIYLSGALVDLTEFAYEFYGVSPLLLIDEYDQPIMSSYEHNYRDEMGNFFSNLYGSAMKSNPSLGQALLTGVQRVAKESIFSQFNNVKVCTVMSKHYSSYFGLTKNETAELLNNYKLELTEEIKKRYDGYLFAGIAIYNPWSVLNYADTGIPDNYWVNTSTNAAVKELLRRSDRNFLGDFSVLAVGREVEVEAALDTAYIESKSNQSLWGLLVNAGYLTATKRVNEHIVTVKIPNDEVMSAFKMMIANISGTKLTDLDKMFNYLKNKEMDKFLSVYNDIVVSCVSYMDAKENSYHMLFLGMSMYLRDIYDIKSNREYGYGRPDIRMEAKKPLYQHIIIEFKQGKESELEQLKEDALQQIIDKEYYAGLMGEVLCIGIAHDKKHCCVAYKTVQN